EFLSHYYEHNMRPRSAYAFGWIYWWSRLASWIPRIANFLTHAPGLGRIVKAAGGIAQERILPNFAHQTFKKWFNQNRNWTNGHEKPKVILWADTFSNNFKPQTLMAATEVLEEAGYRVKITQQSLCCGRPLYDFGFLEQAKDMLGEILGGL